jgi:hypothetical protein
VSAPGTIRERVQRASAFFRELEGVVLTTFHLSAAFVEEHALAAVLGVEAETAPSRRAELHQRLAITPCTVFYDPSVAPRVTGRFRYVARPVPVRGRFFHPKLVVIAGRSDDDATWLYLAVSSANLTLSGWGRNAESFGETWIHARSQESWSVLDELLAWLQGRAALGETPDRSDAVTRVRAALARMPDRRRLPDDGTSPWSGTLGARLYASPVHADGLPAYLRMGRARRPTRLWAYSPYWSQVAELVEAFGARETTLVPALRADGAALGLARSEAEGLDDRVEVQKNPHDIGTRFWHMKAYWITHGEIAYTAVGSCNFTRAGLVGADGNVEAMLVFEADPDWLPDGEAVAPEQLADEVSPEEDEPEPVPVAIVVAWDWRARSWRWWLEAGPRQTDFVLNLPGSPPIAIDAGTTARSGAPPTRGATFTVRYRVGEEERHWRGQIIELNLDHSPRTYGRPLAAMEILESWRGRALTWDLGGGGGGAGDPSDDGDDAEEEVPAAFDAVNLYDLYRSMVALRARLVALSGQEELQRAYLVGRPNSVIALAVLADRDGEAPIVRYLVLRELGTIVDRWRELLDATLVERFLEIVGRAKARASALLEEELGAERHKAAAMLDWFEQELGALDGGVAP